MKLLRKLKCLFKPTEKPQRPHACSSSAAHQKDIGVNVEIIRLPSGYTVILVSRIDE